MKRAFVVAGMAYGDEGKGATTDWLCRNFDAKLVVRYNGGPQAGHTVVCPDGRWHTFSQFGSGTFIPGVRTHLSRFMLVNPISMMREEEHLRQVGVTDAFERLSVDQNCVIVTPFHRTVNRIEQIVRGTHSSCGSGVGRARGFSIEHPEMTLRIGDLHNPDVVLEKLMSAQIISFCDARDIIGGRGFSQDDLHSLKDLSYVEWVAERYAEWYEKVDVICGRAKFASMLGGTTVFEGAQGVLLDETHGEQGFNTWTNTTFENAFTLLKECDYDGEVMKLGVVRTYFTRHGDGPFPTEIETWHPAEPHNTDDGYQGRFRAGSIDWKSLQRAVDLCGGIDGFVVNHVDSITEFMKPYLYGLSYHREYFEQLAPLCIEGYGPTADHRRIIGDWTRCRKLMASGSQKH